MKKKMGCLSVALVGVSMLFSPVAASAATIISAANPQAIYEVARGFGAAEMGKDSTGDPKITGMIEGRKYNIIFSSCKNNKDCKVIQFWAAWSASNVTQSQMNEWNKGRVFGKAYLDSDNDPNLELTVNLKGGVTKENLEDTFDWWRVALKSFASFITD
ncbi:YbjN domain-containing protein [Niveispirillum fermenti]|uniref:YbjN domain-containing protein n=2 Tax=Niveispirillum fermenti TaxID=1233113 RepID=UPI003A87C6EB